MSARATHRLGGDARWVGEASRRFVPAAQGDGHKMAAEGHGELQGVVEPQIAADQRNAIQIAFRIGIREVDRWRREAVAQGQRGQGQLDAAASDVDGDRAFRARADGIAGGEMDESGFLESGDYADAQADFALRARDKLAAVVGEL